jgi:FAD/FMN-containing dehydrogenase
VEPPTERDLGDLARAIDGDVIADPAALSDAARRTFNARFDDRVPQAVVRCASADDVAEAIRFVRRHRLGSAVRAGGHCFAGRSTTRGIVLDVSAMRAVEVADGVVRVGSGATLGEVLLSTLPHGLAIPAGTCPSVGVAGLTLGGGLGLLGRTHGVTSDRLEAAQIVLADGRIVDTDEHREPDLFWALRGAGTGHFGVVTELTFRPVPAPPATTFHLTWPFRDAADVVDGWMAWGPPGPDALSASAVLTASADPEEEPILEVFGTMLGPAADTRDVLDELTGRIATDPDSTFLEEMSWEDTARYWGARAGATLEDSRAGPPDRGIHVVKSEFFERPLDHDTVVRLLSVLGERRVEGEARELDLSPWGGAYVRVPPDATAFVHRGASFWVKHAAALGQGASAAAVEAARRWAVASWRTVHPFGSGGVFPNFPDPDLEDWARAYYGSNLDRLLSLKARYDPQNVFRSPQSLPVRS